MQRKGTGRELMQRKGKVQELMPTLKNESKIDRRMSQRSTEGRMSPKL